FFFFFQAGGGIQEVERSRGLGDVYKRKAVRLPKNNFLSFCFAQISIKSRTTNNKKPLTSIDYDGSNLNNRLYNTARHNTCCHYESTI
ncbi:hypothetical protein, partial [Escherichia coli]|uniref:hypothetical protein n=1 Tax=Escherichia coli TaxID=562 RepID=UPI001BC86001